MLLTVLGGRWYETATWWSDIAITNGVSRSYLLIWIRDVTEERQNMNIQVICVRSSR